MKNRSIIQEHNKVVCEIAKIALSSLWTDKSKRDLKNIDHIAKAIYEIDLFLKGGEENEKNVK